MKKVVKIFFFCVLIFFTPVVAAGATGRMGRAPQVIDSMARKAAIDSAVAARIASASRYTTTAKERAAATASARQGLKRSVLKSPAAEIVPVLCPGDERMGLSRLQSIIDTLCSSDYAGRLSGTAEAKRAADFIAEEFKSLDITLCPEHVGGNVVARIPGMSDEYVVVAAYYDGLGAGYPGANANASGVAALLEIARQLQSASQIDSFRRGVIFVALDGHFCNYSGARALLSELGPRRVTRFINLDILGNASDPVDKRRPLYLMALGAENHGNSLRTCARLGRLETYTEYYRSESFTNMFYRKTGDQTVFLQAGVPCIVFTSGITYDTNKPTDTPDKVNFNALRDRSLAISRFVLSHLL